MQPSSVVKAASHPRLQHELETRMGSVRDSSERTCWDTCYATRRSAVKITAQITTHSWLGHGPYLLSHIPGQSAIFHAWKKNHKVIMYLLKIRRKKDNNTYHHQKPYVILKVFVLLYWKSWNSTLVQVYFSHLLSCFHLFYLFLHHFQRSYYKRPGYTKAISSTIIYVFSKVLIV